MKRSIIHNVVRMVISILLVLLTCGNAIADYGENEQDYAWVICQPDSYVCLRSSPSFNGTVVAMPSAGDRVVPDGRKHGQWVYVGFSCETGGGWIHSGYLTDSEPEIYPDGLKVETDCGKVKARRYAGGPVRNTLKKGTVMTAYLASDEWTITNKGYIRTEYLLFYGEGEPDDALH